MKVTQVASSPPSAAAARGGKPARLPEGGEKADELQHHDQRPRRRLRHAEPVKHLAGGEPVIVFDRLLRDIGEHGIGAAERHQRHFGEKQRDLAKNVGRSEPKDQDNRRRDPKRAPKRGGLYRADQARRARGRACARPSGSAPPGVAWRAAPRRRQKTRNSRSARPRKPTRAGRNDDQREGRPQRRKSR